MQSQTHTHTHQQLSSSSQLKPPQQRTSQLEGIAASLVNAASFAAAAAKAGAAAAATNNTVIRLKGAAGNTTTSSNSKTATMSMMQATATGAGAGSSAVSSTTTTPVYTTLSSMIGFGVSSLGDASDAAVKAVRDAMERGMLLQALEQQEQNIASVVVSIQLGVPPCLENLQPHQSIHPLRVDAATITALLPTHVPIQPIQVQVGGLMIPATSNTANGTDNKPTCIVVACLGLLKQQQQAQQQTSPSHHQHEHEQMSLSSPTSVTTSPHGPVINAAPAPAPPVANAPGTNTNLQSQQHQASAALAAALQAQAQANQHHSPVQQGSLLSSPNNNSYTTPPLSPPQQQPVLHNAPFVPQQQQASPTLSPKHGLKKKQTSHNFHPQVQVVLKKNSSNNSPGRKQGHNGRRSLPCRANSMDVLAHVSAEIIGGHHHKSPKTAATAASSSHQRDDSMDTTGTDDKNNSPLRYNYKKLPPGKTPKNHKRLYVKHVYRDFGREVPLPEEMALMGPHAPSRTPNAAFPLKLHEILTQIEHDGLDSIVGWLPHGRSFKIHMQQEFVDTILPKYFVMTKKSSFLRQLNLYGFNRLSGVGLDQGSYYHEKFLRGMKFLSRRMQRQKVNGNGIRAAGNPDEEPSLSNYPTCPPAQIVVHQQPEVYYDEEDTEEEQEPPQPQVQPRLSPPHPPFHISSESRSRQVVASSTTMETRSNSHASRTNGHSSRTPAAADSPNDRSGKEEQEQQESQGDAALRRSANLQASFPLKLQRILDKLEADGETDVVSWLPHGRAFIVHDVDRFVDDIMPMYFNQSKYSSFQRQCHMYHFERLTAGRDKGAYHHPNFLRGQPELSVKMQRTRVNGKGTRRPGNPEKEPDLYALPAMPPIEPGTEIEIPLEQHQHPNMHGDHCGESHTSGTTSGDE